MTHYSEDTPVQQIGLFGWRRVIIEHLGDCARQRRVFREAINEVRREIHDDVAAIRRQFLEDVERMHGENQRAISAILNEIRDNQQQFLATLKWAAGGIIVMLVTIIGGLINHFVMVNHL